MSRAREPQNRNLLLRFPPPNNNVTVFLGLLENIFHFHEQRHGPRFPDCYIKADPVKHRLVFPSLIIVLSGSSSSCPPLVGLLSHPT